MDMALPDILPEGDVQPTSDREFVPDVGFVSDTELKRRERDNTVAALEYAHWKVFGPGGAAELLGVKPTTLITPMKKMGIEKPH